MAIRPKNVQMDRDQHTEERGASAQVRQFGGVRPRGLSGSSPPPSRQSSPSRAASPISWSAGSSATHIVQSTYGRKEKRLLALLPPPREEEEEKLRMTKPHRDSAVKSKNENDMLNKENNLDRSNDEGADAEDDKSVSQNSLGPQPLEEQLCLDDLQRLMYFFSMKCNVFDDNKTISNDSPLKKKLSSKTSFMRFPKVNRLGEETEGRGHSRASRHSETPLVGDKKSPRKMTTELYGVPNETEEDNEIKIDMYQLLMSYSTRGKSSSGESYTRVLTEKEFAQAVRYVLPGATDSEIMELMKKVDYEAKKRISWDDFATYLLSRGQHRSNLVQGTIAELLSTPEPISCIPSMRHVTGTCMEINPRRKLLLTGGSEGTVRAWNLKTLSSCGIVYAGDSWVVGVHWADQIQCIFIVTMDRKLIILDSKTLEVKRLYRGRAVVDTVDGYMYAHDSVHHVKIGGKIKPKGQHYNPMYEIKSFSGLGGNSNSTTANATNTSVRGSVDGGQILPPVKRPKEKRGKDSPEAMISLATPGTGPYVQCRVEECILAGLVDSISCSLFHHTALREDMIILATVIGEVRFYAIPKTSKRLVTPHAVVRLHDKRINKMSIMYDTYSLLTASDDGTVKMTSLDTGILLRTFTSSGPEQHSAVHDFAVHSQLRFLVTVGPERYGMVWDFSHDAPMAVLDAHNSPCRSCAVHLKQNQIFTSGTDGSIFIFDTQGFRLIQVLHVPNLNPQRIMFDEPRFRLLCLASYPYYHGQQRYAVSACASKYQGHMVSMVGVIYNKTYDLIITIDVEGLVMTWKRSDGSPVFTFQLKEFSDSAVMNAARLTCFALDGLERRLLTGFQNGAVAVWNVVNGQTINVITAAAESFSTTTMKPEVTALGSLARDGITFFIFAAGGQLFFTRESSTFTIASASKWEVPEEYGEVLAMRSVSPQIIVCGTSSGALFFYHVLAERQEGSPLWVVDVVEPVRRSIQQPTLESRRSEHQGNVLTSRIIKIFPLEEVGAHILMTVHSDGTVALWHTLRKLLMETVNVRRAFPSKEGESGLTHVVLDKGNQHFVFADDSGNIHVCSIRLRAVPDEGSMRLLSPQSQATREGKTTVFWPGSPFDSPEFAQFLDSKLNSKDGKEKKKKESNEQQQQQQQGLIDEEKTPYVFAEFTRNYVFHSGLPSVSGVAIIGDPTQADTSGIISTREFSVSEELKGNAASLSPSPPPLPSLAATSKPSVLKEEEEKEREKEKGKETNVEKNDNQQTEVKIALPTNGGSFSSNVPFAFAPPTKYGGLIVVSSGADNFTRVFLLDGTIVGECGMNTWKLGTPSTYEFLGLRPTRRLPPHYCNVEIIDFLQDSPKPERSLIHNSKHNRSLRGTLRMSKAHGGEGSVVHEPLTRRVSSITESNNGVLLHSTTGHTEIFQGEPSNMQSLGMEILERIEQKHHEDIEKGKSRLLQISKSPFPDEGVALSTRIRSRRSREENFKGLVKSEYISKLRGIPLVETEEDSTTGELSSVMLSGTKYFARGEQGSESSVPPFTQSNQNTIKATSSGVGGAGSSIVEGTFTATETQNSPPPPVTILPSNSTHANRTPRMQMGLTGLATPPTVTAVTNATVPTTATTAAATTTTTSTTAGLGGAGTGRKLTVISVMDKDVVRAPATSVGRTSVVFNNSTPLTEGEMSRNELIQEHMRSQRRMLISLGRADSVLEAALPNHSTGGHSTGSTAWSTNSNTEEERTRRASRRGKASFVEEARGHVAQITAQLQVVHIEPMLPPKGTRAREELNAWSEKVSTISSQKARTGK
ncbi:putative WD40 repeat protein [Trypanosoma theileri]|uniref:Putative WD40 repeat protein n=1 Tax=Trypanosoma theileri TaxID=67003 RepID=A0A1X0P141_9TRYP|nr:putative WD40 repeat protein [Trypanosoma theileri]ORC90551.1 putative WD40 repeat protein [Trypanosoma theileri]